MLFVHVVLNFFFFFFFFGGVGWGWGGGGVSWLQITQ